MTEIVNISTSQTEIAAGHDAPATVNFDVVNVSGRRLDVKLVAVPDPASGETLPDWISVSGADTISLDVSETRKIVIEVVPPVGAEAGEIAFCLRAFEPALPEENTDLSSVVTASVASGAAPPQPGVKWGLIAAVFVGILVLIGGGLGAYMLMRGSGSLPDVAGLTLSEAETQLQGTPSASLSTVPVPLSAIYPEPGIVAGQTPAPGVDFAENLDIVLQVTTLQMPDVMGATQEVALAALAELGIAQVEVVIETPPVRDATGLITKQRPGPREFLLDESEVALVIPTEAPVVMPDVVGQQLALARSALADAGIPSSIVRINEPEQDGANGSITAQSPSPGTELTGSMTVTLTVPTQTLIAMPPLTDQTVSRAKQILDAAGFNLDRVEINQPERAGADGRVTEQIPAFNERVPPNTRVVLTAPRAAQANVCATAPFSGTWGNADQNTRSVTRIIVKPNCSNPSTLPTTYTVQMFGSCTPQDCDWGEAQATLSGNRLRLTYDQGFVVRDIQFGMDNGQLVSRIKSDYRDNRADRDDTQRFNRMLILNPNFVLRNLPLAVQP